MLEYFGRTETTALHSLPQLLAILVFIWFVRRQFKSHTPEPPVLRSVAILVLGDVGRSPRMMYHAQSFATNGFRTYLIGYRGSDIIKSIRVLPNLRCVYLSTPPSLLRFLPFILLAPIKVAHQICTILFTLLFTIPRPPEFILVQNPPSIPTLALVSCVAWLRGSKVIIDWHNLGYTILALKIGEDHILVKIAKRFEQYFGQYAYAHLFVTEAMRKHLVKGWDLKGIQVVLHDRPLSHLHRCTAEEIHTLFIRLKPLLNLPALRDYLPEYDTPYSTPFTTTNAQKSRRSSIYANIDMPSLRPDRPALVISSTSWTDDEDFGLLISALEGYELRARDANASSDFTGYSLPKILMVITGKGPLKEYYMNKVGEKQQDWRFVKCVSLWLEAEDYPLVLGSADLGVCLHTSSSGLDLPMKVVDMFGCGLPVCAVGFNCLDELVKDNVNGLVFENAEQLSEQLIKLLSNFPRDTELLEKLRQPLSRSHNNYSHLDSQIRPSSPPAYLGPTTTDVRHSRSATDATVVRMGGDWRWNSWEEEWDAMVRPIVMPTGAKWTD